MQYPTNLQIAHLSAATGGAGAFTTPTILGPPGPARRYRIWYINLGREDMVQLGNVLGSFQAVGGLPAIGLISCRRDLNATLYLPGGFAMPVDIGVRVVLQSDLAGQNIGAQFGYTIEAV